MDRDETPQQFPLQKLLRQAVRFSGAEVSTCDIFKARGYGLHIREWDVRLGSEDSIPVSVQLLDNVSEGTEEWFYDLEARLSGTDILFGLLDSWALFVDAPAAVADKIAAAFSESRPAK